MKIRIKDIILLEKSCQFSFKLNGDKYEREFYELILNDFPNVEWFWKNYISIMTNRVVDNSVKEDIRARDGISRDVVDISIIHYSIYMNLVYAKQCLLNKHISFFENFYTHLGSVCDLVEEFIKCVYLLHLKCNQLEPEVITRLTKREFQDVSSKWYDENYSSLYTHYLSKGKFTRCELIGVSNILDEYFKDFIAYKNYKNFSSNLREYRNVIVHNTQIASHHTVDKVFIPKLGKIKDYKKWYEVFEVSQERFKIDFVDRDSQMNENFTSLIKILNELWVMPINTMNNLLYVEKNTELLEMYQIDLS